MTVVTMMMIIHNGRGCPWISLLTRLEEGCVQHSLDISGIGRVVGEVRESGITTALHLSRSEIYIKQTGRSTPGRRILMLLTPALLCYKDTAQGKKAPSQSPQFRALNCVFIA